MNRESQGTLDLRSLLGHSESVAADAPLEVVHRRFSENGRDFMAVLDGSRLLGVCARRDIAMQLGARFGFALFAQSQVRDHMMGSALSLCETAPLHEVLAAVSSRANDAFYDDVLLVDQKGGFIGFIFVHALARLQTELLLANIDELERSRILVAEKNQAMEDDLLMAREVQLAMLPPARGAPDAMARWRFYSEYRPAGGVSGDFFQLIRVSNDAAGILVCDVMGHGVRSALVTAMLRAFAEDLRPVAADPGALLTRLNQCLMGVLRQTGNLLFVTAAYAFADIGASSLAYGQAGHPTGLFRSSLGRVELLPADGEAAGPALGLIGDFQYLSTSRSFKDGDSVVLFTDGLTEARNPAGDEWGKEGLMAAFARHSAARCEDLLCSVVETASAFLGGGHFEDDLCIVSLYAGR